MSDERVRQIMANPAAHLAVMEQQELELIELKKQIGNLQGIIAFRSITRVHELIEALQTLSNNSRAGDVQSKALLHNFRKTWESAWEQASPLHVVKDRVEGN